MEHDFQLAKSPRKRQMDKPSVASFKKGKLTKMLRGPRTPEKHTPSSFIAEMGLTTEELLARINEVYPPRIVELIDIGATSAQKECTVDVDQALFQPFPSDIVFQKFKPHQTIEIPLSFRNLDRFARHLKVTHEESPYFNIVSQWPSGKKVAPGMEINYVVQFTPDENKDYIHELVCITEREKFIVPIQAIGARALIDFPDNIYFPSAPVKHKSVKTILIRNIGNAEAKFNLDISSPFSTSVATGTLNVNECMQVDVCFQPKKTGDHNCELVINYGTGEEVYIQLHGTAIDVNVRLDKSSLMMEDTFLGLTSQRTVTLHNRTDVIVHYDWRVFGSDSEEQLQKEMYGEQLIEEESSSKETFLERCLHNPSLRDRYPILTRNFETKKKALVSEKFLYSSDVFTLDPPEGDIWPNSLAEITVTFQPEVATSYSSVAYCDVTGRESRLPLRLKGDGLGPKLHFSFDTLDIQNIFVNSAHAYEVVLENKGEIDASYALQSSTSLFGPKFSFNPSSGHLMPDGLQAIQISFSSSTLGNFDEEFAWVVDGAPYPLKLRIMGRVIGPTFQFSVPEIKFGLVSYSFPHVSEVVLSNTSEVPMTFRLRVPGEERTKHSDHSKNEFVIQPHSGMLPPSMQRTIKVTFTPMYLKNYSTCIVVDVEEAGKDIFSLPVTANSVVPQILLLTPQLPFSRCFINHPYTKQVQLLNDSSLLACYEMAPQVENASIACTTKHPKGIIKEHSSLTIHLEAQARAVGELSTPVMFQILGSSDPPLVVNVTCCGEGPVVSISPNKLEWGAIPVLTPLEKTLTLVNESSIDAEFETVLMRDNSVFTIVPASAIIDPYSSLDVTITADLDDAIKFSDKLTIIVLNGIQFTVPLTAEGKGTTIISHPSMYPRVNLGTQFACRLCRQQYTLTNRGRRTQALSWTTEGFSMVRYKRAEMEKTARDRRDVAKKGRKQESEVLVKPMFQISPDKFMLSPFESQTVTIEGISTSPRPVHERLVCQAIIGKNPYKERIMAIDVTAEFIAPLMEFSTRELTFTTHQPPGSKLTKHTQDLSLKNISPLPLTVLLRCNYPFSLFDKQTQSLNREVALLPGEQIGLVVLYDSTYCADRHTHHEHSTLEITYQQHPHKDYIQLKADVYFPNLDFSSTRVEFGSILNHTEAVREITMINSSPLEVRYSWSFLHHPPVRRVDPLHDDEGVDMQSECDESTGTEGGGSTPSLQPAPCEDQDPSLLVAAGITVALTTPSPDGRGQVTRRETGPSMEEKEEEDDSEEEMTEIHISEVESGVPLEEEEKDKEEKVEKEDEEEEKEEEEEEEEEELQESSHGKKKRASVTVDPWQTVDDPFVPISIEQVFDLLPLYGVLQPGEAQQLQVTFYGHVGVATEVAAVCRVEGGPTYELRLCGEASSIQYSFDKKKINIGKMIYDQVYTDEVTLANTGKVSLDFCAVGVSDTADLLPGQVSITPPMGQISSLESQTLVVKFFPGVPGDFHKDIQIQVAHFEPDVLTLRGEASFPRLSLDVSHPASSPSCEQYEELRAAAIAVLEKKEEQTPGGGGEQYCSALLDEEMEKLLVSRCVNQQTLPTSSSIKKLPRVILPEYHLDFGYVVHGLMVSHCVTLTNIGYFPLSFTTAFSSLTSSGFSVDLGSKVRALPGAPQHETITFNARFDSKLAKLGHAEATLPFQLYGGPVYPLKFTAEVTVPIMELSSSQLNFGTVLCGQCKIITVRFHNPLQVRCEWNAKTDKPVKKIPKYIPLHVRKKMKDKPPPRYFEVDPSVGILLPGQSSDVQVKFMPSEELHYTERIPLIISQNSYANIVLAVEGRGSEPQVVIDKTLVEFAPVMPYSDGSEVEITVTNPTDAPVELYSLEFDKQYLEEEKVLRWVKEYDHQHRLFLPPVEPGGTLPDEIMDAYKKDQPTAAGAAAKKLVHEFVGEEHEALGSTISVDKPGSQTGMLQLPQSVTEILQAKLAAVEGQSPHPSSTALLHPAIGVTSYTSVLSHATLGSIHSPADLPGLDSSPVALCIARHLGYDLTPEGALAENRKGIAVVVYGAPTSGKSTQAKLIASKYDAAVLVMDDLIIDAISTASTPAGCRAREACIDALIPKTDIDALPPTTGTTITTGSKPVPGSRRGSGKSGPQAQVSKDIPADPPLLVSQEPSRSFTVQPLEDTPYAVPSGTLVSTVLPEEVIVEIITDRLQNTDCRKGFVFDGLVSMFAVDPLMVASLILKAFSNRKHIFFVNIDMNIDSVQDRIAEIEAEKKRQLEEDAKVLREKEEEERALLDLDEDEYEQLPEEKKMEIDMKRMQLYLEKRERINKEKELLRIEKEKRDIEAKEEEERAKKGGKKGKQPPIKAMPAEAKSSRPESSASTTFKDPSTVLGGPGSVIAASGVSVASTDSKGKKVTQRLNSGGQKGQQDRSLSSPLEPSQELRKRISYYEAGLSSIKGLLENWDRQTGEVKVKKPPPPPPETEPNKITSSTPKKKGRKTQASMHIPNLKQDQSPSSPQHSSDGSSQPMEEESNEGIGVPLISVPGSQKPDEVTSYILNYEDLPRPEEIFESLGLGPNGPPIMEPVTFQVYPYPLKRRPVLNSQREHFCFISSGPHDPNAMKEDEPTKTSPEPATLDDGTTKEPDIPVSRQGKRTGSVKYKDDSRKRSSKQGGKAKQPSSPSARMQSPAPDSQSIDEAGATATTTPSKELTKYRWVIPPKGARKFKLLFSSEEEGQFDQTLNFEIVGTRRHYQLFCRGLCYFPSLSREPRVVFPHRKRSTKKGEIIHKKFVMDEGKFYFGPLHSGKSRERYREGRFPENMETLAINNSGCMEAELTFNFKEDTNTSTFLLAPSNMLLQPGETQSLNIWAYPKSLAEFNDVLVCCLKHNPEPVLFPICCNGVEPDLKVDKKSLEFGKVLLHRKESRVLHLRNSTLLPVAWKLSGQEMLGEEFSFNQEQGIVQPKSEFPLTVHFRAVKPNNYKKNIKVEISDVEQNVGLMHVEQVVINAEAYDVALDISFPKGTDGGLDFQCLRVGDELKLSMSLKNKGKYDIAFNFFFEDRQYEKYFFFPLNLAKDNLYPGEKSKAVAMVFRPTEELCIKEQPILKCQVIDRHISEQEEVIANIPIKISARAVFSKYAISPVGDVNFGALVIGSRRSTTFTIENKGEFEFRYAVSKWLPPELRRPVGAPTQLQLKRGGGVSGKLEVGAPSRSSSVVGKLPGGAKSKESTLRYEVLGGTQKLVLGLFTINPGTALIMPGQSQVINVDCSADRQGKHVEALSIEISDSDKADMPLKYMIGGEVFVPGINSSDIASVFEEHRICRQLGALGPHLFHEDCIGVYGENEQRYLFKGVIVGHSSRARFKIRNTNKVPCDLVFSIKSVNSKLKSMTEAFEVHPSNKVSILPHSYITASVTFKPPAMQMYTAVFDAAIEGPPQARGKGLNFEIQGEGNLPQVSVLQPILRNSKGQPMLLFKRLLLNHTQVLPVLVANTGSIPATVTTEMEAESAFCLLSSSRGAHEEEDGNNVTTKASTSPLMVHLNVGEKQEIFVSFSPESALQYKGMLQLRVQDNQFESTTVVIVGEGYEDTVVFEDIHGLGRPLTMPPDQLAADEPEATKENHLQFGVLPVQEAAQLCFTLTNHSLADSIRFQLPSVPNLTFSPSLGHLHPGRSKEVTAVFSCPKPKLLTQQKFAGKYWRITYSKPLSEVGDWDDRMVTVKWVNVPKTQPTTAATSTNAASTSRPGSGNGKPLPPGPAKQKITEKDPEPEHKQEDGSKDLNVFVSAMVCFTEYECAVNAIRFRDTYMFQTRLYSFPLKNTGSVVISYKWFLVRATPDQQKDEDGNSVKEEEERTTPDKKEEEEDDGPFPITVHPMSGEVLPGEEQLINVSFSPLTVLDVECTLRCQISNTKPSTEPLLIAVQGRSLMPYCHFDLPVSDYLTRRSAEVAAAVGRGGGGKRGLLSDAEAATLGSSTRVIEFSSCGTGTTLTYTFHIINPTDRGYDFYWRSTTPPASATTTPTTASNITSLSSTSSTIIKSGCFQCHTPSGRVGRGRQYKIVFNYTPNKHHLTESLWNFSIPAVSLSIPFLLVGHTLEPDVQLDRAYLSFKSMLVGTLSKKTVYLINNEDREYHYSFVEKSCLSDSDKAWLGVSPFSGVVKPHTKLPIDISFKPTEEREFLFHLQCNVKTKPTPLMLNVKAEGYAVSVAVSLCNPDGKEVVLPLEATALNERVVDFGQVPVNERSLWQIHIRNLGIYRFEYEWELTTPFQKRARSGSHDVVSISPSAGVVPAHDRATSELIFSPVSRSNLTGYHLTLHIANGRPIPIILLGQGTEPCVLFSFTEYDFGPRFLHNSNMPPNEKTLVITNAEREAELSMDCLFTNLPYLEVNFQPQMLAPGESVEVKICFQPHERVKYCEGLEFEVNGICRRLITIRGEGTMMKVELSNLSEKIINFGAQRVMKKDRRDKKASEGSSKLVKLINRSPLPAEFSVAIVPTSTVPALQDKGVLTVTRADRNTDPTGEITLKPNEECTVKVSFCPKTRIPPFSEEVIMESYGISQPLFVVKGSCHGIEITLDSEHVPFGAVVLHSLSKRRVLMVNSGDIGASFKWDTAKFAPDFSISPAEGYISSGMEVAFDVTFHPRNVCHDIRYNKLPCEIEGGNPLCLTLTGVCIEQVPQREVVNFTTVVRGKETRQISLHNKTATHWLLYPIIDGEYWTGPESISIEAGETRSYNITYHPLTMTQDALKHQGSIFFPLPDGTGQLYNLSGTADPPKHTGSVVQEIPCKTTHTELLTVYNWLRRPQRFRADTQMIRPEKLERSVYMYGVEYIDVPALGKKDYKLNFYSFKEGSFLAKVTFTNEQTGEYQFYHVHFKSTQPGVMGTIELTTPVRKSASHTITIDNPFPTSVTMNTTVNVPDITIPNSFLIGAESQGKCTFEFLPLKVGETTGKLTLQSADHGYYHYELHLTATPPTPERPVHFTTTLGSTHQQQCHFNSFAKGRTEYFCKIDSSEFSVDKSVTAASSVTFTGTEALVDVHFEPSCLGDTRAMLSISSPTGGEYSIPLIGHCLEPKPQGPFVIKAGYSINIPFRNVFHQPKQFNCSIDNPVFSIKPLEVLKARKTYNILVHYDARQGDPSVTKLGKLLVSCQHHGKPGGLQWTFYLKGVPVDSMK